MFFVISIAICVLSRLTVDFGPLGVFLAITLAQVLIVILSILWFKIRTLEIGKSIAHFSLLL